MIYMQCVTNKKACCGCGACAQACPVNCIRMAADAEGFRYPEVDEAKCIQCGLCQKICPVMHKNSRISSTPKAYAAYNLDEKVRMASSSGGVFSLVAEHVLAGNGVVYGAALTKDQKVRHIRVTDPEAMAALRGSKYVQSDTDGIYLQVKRDLDAGRPVLFTGTPCQVAGLRSFLRKEYDNLFCMDIICHGVPSPMVWEKYVAHRENIAESPVTQISFRNKSQGWKTYAVNFGFSNDAEYLEDYRKDAFMRAFLQDLCLRPSCYACAFKTANRISDMTLADFWGIENVCPEMDDDKGTSLVLLHSKTGEMLFEAIRGNLRYREVDFEAAVKGNPAITESARKPENRDNFMEDIQTNSFDEVAVRYVKRQISFRDIVKSILAKLKLLGLAKKLKRLMRG